MSAKAVARRKCDRCGLRRQETAFTGPRGKVCKSCRDKKRKETARASHVRRTYDLSVEDIDAIANVQGGVCAICKGTRTYNLAVDHDHDVEEVFGTRKSVRGLLCKRCNSLLADVRDNPDLLLAAAGYLIDPPARKALAA